MPTWVPLIEKQLAGFYQELYALADMCDRHGEVGQYCASVIRDAIKTGTTVALMKVLQVKYSQSDGYDASFLWQVLGRISNIHECYAYCFLSTLLGSGEQK